MSHCVALATLDRPIKGNLNKAPVMQPSRRDGRAFGRPFRGLRPPGCDLVTATRWGSMLNAETQRSRRFAERSWRLCVSLYCDGPSCLQAAMRVSCGQREMDRIMAGQNHKVCNRNWRELPHDSVHHDSVILAAALPRWGLCVSALKVPRIPWSPRRRVECPFTRHVASFSCCPFS